jgi:hypothetical protein
MWSHHEKHATAKFKKELFWDLSRGRIKPETEDDGTFPTSGSVPKLSTKKSVRPHTANAASSRPGSRSLYNNTRMTTKKSGALLDNEPLGHEFRKETDKIIAINLKQPTAPPQDIQFTNEKLLVSLNTMELNFTKDLLFVCQALDSAKQLLVENGCDSYRFKLLCGCIALKRLL